MADVFISYASEDRERVAPVADFLESSGWSVWWDRHLNVGTSFDREIERELDAAGCVLVVWSKFSIDSDWVRAEAEEGMSRGSLVPILFDPVRPPLAFRRIQTEDVTGGLTTEIQGDLAAAITRVTGTPGTGAASSQYDSVADHEQEVRYTMSADNVRIAWAQTGEGPTIVRVLNWASNLETEWSEPGTRRFIDMLSASFKLIRYNGRGTGLSETRPEFTYNFDERYSDLEAVMSACSEKRVIVFGISEGAPAAVAWAAQNPERTSHLVLLGAANVHPVDEDVLADTEWLYKLVEACWGREETIPLRLMKTLFGFDLPGAEIDDHSLVKMLQEMHTREVIGPIFRQIVQTGSQVDMKALAPKVQAPTLIIHSRNDVLVEPENSQFLASLIPNARLMLIDGKNHVAGFVGSYDELVTEELKSFVGV